MKTGGAGGFLGGGFLIAHGSDQVIAGVRQAWSGRATRSATQFMIESAALAAGHTAENAAMIGEFGDLAFTMVDLPTGALSLIRGLRAVRTARATQTVPKVIDNLVSQSADSGALGRSLESVGGGGSVASGSDVLRLTVASGDRRLLPGVASHGGNLPTIQKGQRWLRGSHGNAAKVPSQIAEQLAGQRFSSFNDFREAFWRAVANDSVLSSQFKAQNIARMKRGRAPFAVTDQQVGGRAVYELDHLQEIQHGGNVYDLDNIIIRTPLNHIRGK